MIPNPFEEAKMYLQAHFLRSHSLETLTYLGTEKSNCFLMPNFLGLTKLRTVQLFFGFLCFDTVFMPRMRQVGGWGNCVAPVRSASAINGSGNIHVPTIMTWNLVYQSNSSMWGVKDHTG
jgi:hypothetical protein